MGTEDLRFFSIGKDFLREELETAWLRGQVAGERRAGKFSYGEPKANKEVLQEAADYAERVVGGSTRPSVPTPQGDQGQAPPPEAERPEVER